MAQDGGGQDLMGYEALAQEALRGVVRAALKRAAGPGGIPGAHHFYLSFKTQAPGVSIPPDLVEKYPDEMTIVLQHQFWDLAPGETFFSITLRFGGQPKPLSMPYGAVTRFYDPSVQFLLQFEAASEGSDTSGPAAELVSLRTRKELAGDARTGGPQTNESQTREVQGSAPRALPAPKKPAEAKKPSKTVEPATPPSQSESTPPDGPKIVSLDKFRKK
jgi:hypothetical protein